MNDKTLLFFLVISFAAPASADEYRNRINEGYEYYKNGEYGKAGEDYRQAGIIKPDKALPNFGKGAALYRSNDFEGASREYGAVIDKGDDRIKADAHYNIGNAFYKAEKYGEAVKSYINALKINPDDSDYKHNLEMALLKQQLQQQQQQQQQDQDENQDQKEQKQQDKGQKDQKDQDQKQQQQQKDQKQDDSEKDQQQQSVDEQQMSEEDAKNLLSRFEEDEKEIQKRLKQVDIGRSSGHDW